MTETRNDWRVTMTLFALTGFVESLTFGHLAAYTPLFLRQELRIPPSDIRFWTGFLSAVGYPIGLLLLPFWASWAGKYGRKLIIIRSSVIASALFAVIAMSDSVGMMAVGRFLAGFVLGNTGLMIAMQADLTPKHRLAWAISIVGAGSPIALSAGPLMGGWIAETYGIRTLLWFDSLATLALVICLCRLLHDEPGDRQDHPSALMGAKESLRTTLHTPGIPLFFVGAFLVSYGVGASSPYAPLVIENLHRGAHLAATIGSALTPMGVLMALATPFWGIAGTRWNVKALLIITIASVSASLALQALSVSVGQFASARGVQGAMQAGISTLGMLFLTQLTSKENRSSVLTLSLLPNQLAWFLGPASAAALGVLGVTAPFWVGAGASLSALVFLSLIPNSKCNVRDNEID